MRKDVNCALIFDVLRSRCSASIEQVHIVDKNVELIDRGATDYIEMTTGIVAAYVSNNHVQGAELATLIASTHAALSGLGKGAEMEATAVEKLTPAQIRKSIT